MNYPEECKKCLVNPCNLYCPNLPKLQAYQNKQKKTN